MKPIFFEYQGGRYSLQFGHYSYGNRLAVWMIDESDGETYATISVNLPDVPICDNYIFAKNYSENENIYNFLVEKGILIPTGGQVKSGFVSVPICLVRPLVWEDPYADIP